MSGLQHTKYFNEHATPGFRLLVLLITVMFALLILSSIMYGLSFFLGIPLEDETRMDVLFSENPGLLRLTVIFQHVFIFILSPLVFIFLFYGRKFTKYLSLKSVKSEDIWYFLGWLFCMYPFMSVIALWMSYLPLPEWMILMDEDYAETLSGVLKMNNMGDLMLSLLIAAVLPGLGEELLFRGIIQKELSRLWTNPHIAIWVTSVLFSALHFQITGFFPKMMIGLILGYAYSFTKNLWVPMIIHMMNNAFATIALYHSDLPAEVQKPLAHFDTVQMVIFAVFGFASVSYYQMLRAKYIPKTKPNG